MQSSHLVNSAYPSTPLRRHNFCPARSLVLSHLDYCSSLLYGTSTSLIHSLQRIQNKLAKLVLLNPTLNSTDCLKKLHWLPIHNRIIFKIALMTYRTLATSNPPPPSPPPCIWSSLIFHHSTKQTSSQIIPHQQRLLVCLSCCLECLTSPSKRSTIPGALQKSPEDPPLQDKSSSYEMDVN